MMLRVVLYEEERSFVVKVDMQREIIPVGG